VDFCSAIQYVLFVIIVPALVRPPEYTKSTTVQLSLSGVPPRKAEKPNKRVRGRAYFTSSFSVSVGVGNFTSVMWIEFVSG